MMILSPGLVIAAVVLLYLISSIHILREYERGVIFRLGKLLPQPKGPGIILVFRPIDTMVKVSSAHGGPRRAAAGHHHARQRLGEGERRRLFQGDRSAARHRGGGRLHVRHVPARADDAAQRAGTSRARRSAWRSAIA